MAEPAAVPPANLLDQYAAAAQQHKADLHGASMEVSIEASLPRLKKTGRLHALRRISEIGRITYEALKFEGDGTVKNNVIVRYLTAEAQAAQNGQPDPALAVTPDNYKFKYKTYVEDGTHRAYVFQVTPKKKRVGLFKGEVWIDAATYLRVREVGEFVKSPSIFLKKVRFARDYEIRDGVSVPKHMESTIETRIVGKAELKVDFDKVELASAPADRIAFSELQ